MRVLLHSEFAASKKEPLVAMFERVQTAFLDAGLGEPKLQFSLSDAPLPGYVSSVDRVLKRYPELKSFYEDATPDPRLPRPRRLSNRSAVAQPVDSAMLRAIVAGVPKSFPFHNVSFAFLAPAFGETPFQGLLGEVSPGVYLGDSWWVSGRMRSLSAFTFVEAEVRGQKLPPLPDPVLTLFAALGKAKKTVQVPLPGENAALPQAAKAEVLEAVQAVVVNYRAQLPAILERLAFPHDLPPVLEAMQSTARGQATGPKKPVLLRAFRPLGYDCSSESGMFTLRRRTASNLTVEISLDVGTWSRSLSASLSVHGLGFSAPLRLQVSRRSGLGQYPIGDGEHWQKIVDNLAVLVTELEQHFIPAVEAAAGPSPDWYTPEQ